jgi:SRSO17 transposase
MVETTSKWEDELARWLEPFLDFLGHKAPRRMCPLYVSGLIGAGDRKSVQPMAPRLAPGDYDQLHHFIADGVWDAAPLEAELLVQADRLVGGKDAVLVIDDTAMPKKGDRSVGVAPQYASSLGKTAANCNFEFKADRQVAVLGSGSVLQGAFCAYSFKGVTSHACSTVKHLISFANRLRSST